MKVTNKRNNNNQARIDEAEKFFDLLYGAVTERKFGYLWTKQGEERKTFPFDVSNIGERKKMAVKAIELNDAGADVYYGINLMDTPPAANARVTADYVTVQTATVTDIDIEGGNHQSNETKKYPPTFDIAKSFLPFSASILVNSGYGLHGLCIYNVPIIITDKNRHIAEARNKKFLDVIRSRAGNYAKAVDGVGDLPRVFRVPGTRNYKLGVATDAPICHIVEVNDVRFSPADIDEKLNALTENINTALKTQPRATCAAYEANYADDNPDLKEFRIRRMLDYISVVDGEYEKWLAVGFALFNEGCDCNVWEQWSRSQPEFKEGECERKWNGFHHDPNGISIASLYQWATEGGYVEKEIRNDWYQLHPEFKPSAKHNMDETTKRKLDDAIIWLDTLEPENFTADDARSLESIHKVALAAVFGFSSAVENFFKTIKDAKAISKNKIKEANADLTKKLTINELNNLTALVEGINIKFLRSEVDREVTEIKRAQNKFHAQQDSKHAKEKAIKHAKEREQTVEDNIQHLIKLRKEYRNNPSEELAAQIQNLILHTCDVKIDRYTGKTSAVRATQANADLIFSFDPILDGLFGYDQFQQADVFLKAPVWNKNIKRGDEWTDRDDNNLQTYIRRHYVEFASDKLVLKNITGYSDYRAFHEVKEFFRNLPKWDGKKRAEKLFVKFLGADDSPYVREVTLNILTAAVARIFHPGCDYQLAPILLGEQGIGKSHILGKLFGKWYGSLVDDVSDPHAIDAIQKLWGVEIKEMAAMKKDVDANKRFIDSAKDTRRQAYARRATTIPRHCVFVITTNNKMCLTDMTGNRRYPIIVCHNKARHYVEIPDGYILQIWTEVFQHCKELFKDGFDEKKLELSRDSQIMSDEIAEQFTRDDLTEDIKSFIDTKIPPLPIWHQLSREERRKFYAEGNIKLIDGVRDLNNRIRARGGRNAQKTINEIYSILRSKDNGIVEHYIKRNGEDLSELWIYGTQERQHICPVEILYECFDKTDKRKSLSKILESLNNIDGWSQGKRFQNQDPAYKDQKIVFYRNTEE